MNDITFLQNSSKFIELMNTIKNNYYDKYNKHNWNVLETLSQKIINLKKLDTSETTIKNKKFCMYVANSINISNDYVCIINPHQFTISKKSNENTFHKKLYGGIIFDTANQFLSFLDTKSIIISDFFPQTNNSNCIFKHIKSITDKTIFMNDRIYIYHPTDQILETILNLISKGLKQPKNVWIIIPKSSHTVLLNFNNIMNILCWSDNNYECLSMYKNTVKIPTFLHESNNTKIIKKILTIETIQYKPNKLEEILIESVNDNKFVLLSEQIFFSSYDSKKPKNIYDITYCPICYNNFTSDVNIPNTEKIYISCGHIFCIECLLLLFTSSKHNCPLCSKNIRFNSFHIPSMTLSKGKHLIKLIVNLLQQQANNNILIYADTQVMAKGIVSFISKELTAKNIDQKVILIKNKTAQHNSTIFVSSIENGYLCQELKNINNIIVMSSNTSFLDQSEMLGYNWCYTNEIVKVWNFDVIIDDIINNQSKHIVINNKNTHINFPNNISI